MRIIAKEAFEKNCSNIFDQVIEGYTPAVIIQENGKHTVLLPEDYFPFLEYDAEYAKS